MKVKVIIPIYKNTLTDLELISLNRAYLLLSNYPIVIIKPQSLDLLFLLDTYPRLEIESFEDTYFEGIAGYNKLMLSTEFYKRFLSSEYILIHQLDAYLFNGELSAWCEKGYDYIGAPWLKKQIYRLPIISSLMYLIHLYCKKMNIPSKQSFYNKIGNGGLSLRKVKSHYDASCLLQDRIQFFLAQKRSHFYNEDVFWATEVKNFTFPEVREALRFSFDKYPGYCYKLNKKELPFGCHSWYKRKMRKFWKSFIDF